MAALKLGTRGSDLARWQARHVAELLKEHTGRESELVIIKTQGDREGEMPAAQAQWSTGAFVTAIEQALAAGEVDLAIHSHKDLESKSLPGLVIAATPERASMHDILAARDSEVASRLHDALTGGGQTPDLTLGTSSPRREAQLRRAFGCGIAPIRGNVPTRLAIATEGELDAVCLAAAGVERLGLDVAYAVALPIETFPTAPAQGAVAVQAREETEAAELASWIDHHPTRRCAEAERAFLEKINAGCHAPIAASATVLAQGGISLHVQLFKDDGEMYDERVEGADARELGLSLGARALEWYRA